VGGFGQAAVGVRARCGETAFAIAFSKVALSHIWAVTDWNWRAAAGRNRISRCEFFDLGAGGLKLGETAIRENEPEQTRRHEISDVPHSRRGKMFHSAIGIWLGQSADNRIVHNLIHDFYYTGILHRLDLGLRQVRGQKIISSLQYVHHIGIKSDGDGPILSDMGGIYTLGNESAQRS